jgi:ring-1,2-phenylacetyl-CoA epoxidase subunit PaaC
MSEAAIDAPVTAPMDYLLHLADNALVLGQRNAEWCGHGPVLEEDIAMANISLDLVGQARLLYQHAAALAGDGATEDSLAYFRDAMQFRNYTLLELPHHGPLAGSAAANRDYATTIVRNFFYSTFMLLLWEALQSSKDAQLAAIAAKSVKETRYHLRHARDWLVRLGDGTSESHSRMQAALDHLMPYTQEFWTVSPAEAQATARSAGIDPGSLRDAWDRELNEALAEATLQRPATGGYVPRGKEGLHSEHLAYLLAEMQGLARQHPEGRW